MNKITDRQIRAAYDMASAVFDDPAESVWSAKVKGGAKRLHDEHGLNETSASYFITIFKSMMYGEKYLRTLSIPATQYYFEQIEAQRGLSVLAKAIEATRQHLDYRGGQQLKKRKILQDYADRLTQSQDLDTVKDLDTVNEEFARKIEKAAADSPAARQKRLSDAATRPTKIRVTTETYERNPDVVAEVLYQAQGRCGHCGQPAPFLRRKGGTPYLEVHHKKQLKDGGEDTVENAIALCPNCHRRQHHGVPDLEAR